MVDARFQDDAGRPIRVALAHDWLVSMRGGEYVLDRLARLTGPTDLYTLVRSGAPMSPAIDACRIHTSVMQNWPGAAGRLRRWYLPLYPRAVESLRIERSFDLVISTSSAMIKAIVPPLRRRCDASPRRDHQADSAAATAALNAAIPHICYCHSPARYLWDRGQDYSHGRGGLLRRLGLAFCGARLRAFDRRTTDRVSVFVANSTFTARLIRECYGRSAVVVHPPVRTEFFTPDSNIERDKTYLAASALEPYKRIDLAVDAATKRGFRLIVAGDGSQSAALKRRAGPNVQFLGAVDHSQLRDLFRRCRALIFPGLEDFGLIPVEAMACGCPVIAYARGGAEDWFASNALGEVFIEQSAASVLSAIDRFEQRSDIDAEACRTNALRFSEERFDEAMVGVVKDSVGR